ncbi:hypothetical protein [Streptomyces sp. NRRL B-24720]|uniref:hypothetical protein n=1 Tax=Streptomyces sp. NRRL B-24720 TaxID=1476876 RepID=UPI0004C598CE|nr:hypothetical protein [Streptomyces sp. NRRL B-24720]
MPELMVQIDDQTVPLTNCVWITWAPCGCPCGALTAAYGDTAHATESQALAEIWPTKRERTKYTRQGYRVELMGWDRYRADVDLAAKCPHEATA